MISPVQTASQLAPVGDPRNTVSTAALSGNLAPSTSTGTEAGPTKTPVGRANPSFQFDPAAGVVVVQFRDDSGKVDLSLPSQQQLNAYATDRVEGQQPGNNTFLA